MRKLTYLAVFEPTGTGYSVYFPDLPGCVSYGEDFEEAQKQAAEVLGLYIYGMENEMSPLPSEYLQMLFLYSTSISPKSINVIDSRLSNRYSDFWR